MTLNGVVDFAGAKKDTERYTIKLYRFNNCFPPQRLY